MATNVSQQDETLHKVIDWCEQREVEGLRLANALLQKHDLAAYAVVKAQIDAYHKTAEHCRSMLGYSGSMPSCLNYEDIDDSSPDLQPQVGDYGEGWKILRVDIMPPTELSNNAVTATNVYILEREANDD